MKSGAELASRDSTEPLPAAERPAPPLRIRRFVRYALPAIAYAGLIFFLSSLEAVPNLPGKNSDKLIHALEYVFFGALLYRAFAGYGLHPRRALAMAALVGGLYGVTDEIHQRYTPGRSPDVKDAVVDAAGATVGAWALSLRKRK